MFNQNANYIFPFTYDLDSTGKLYELKGNVPLDHVPDVSGSSVRQRAFRQAIKGQS